MALKHLFFERAYDNGTRFLLGFAYWATGSVERYGKVMMLVEVAAGRCAADVKRNEVAENELSDRTLPPAVLVEARESLAVAPTCSSWFWRGALR